MAERRMFAKSIVDSDAFLDMPLSAQALYFHLSMRADDDGFVNNPKKIQRVIGCNDDDFNVLVAKRFILTFESGIIVIKHWKIHNYIRNDRKKDTAYPEEMALLEEKDNGAYTYRRDLVMIEQDEHEDLKTSDLRKKAYEKSSLPYSFDYKIRRAFYGKPCPICNIPMQSFRDGNITTDIHRPSIQHNKPISKGGEHELGNISVICHQCNVSIKSEETDRLNADEVIEVWDCLSNDGQVSAKCLLNDSVGKVSIGKVSIDKDSISCSEPNKLATEPVITIPLNDGSEYGVDEKTYKEFCDLYPAVDVMQELRKMRAWSLSNPSKKKTKRGVLKFVNGWLSKEQDKGGSHKKDGQISMEEWANGKE